eukprot:1188626-Prorocentrum_minimum.AAC.1
MVCTVLCQLPMLACGTCLLNARCRAAIFVWCGVFCERASCPVEVVHASGQSAAVCDLGPWCGWVHPATGAACVIGGSSSGLPSRCVS